MRYKSKSNCIVLFNHNKDTSGGAEGAEVIYALRNNDKLSEKILNNLAQEGQIIRKNYQRRLPSNPSKDYYYILRETPNTEAVIVEYGFLDNAKDSAKLKANYKNYAEAVVRAVMDYKGLKYIPPKESGTEYYTVKSGDTLWTISKKYGLTVDELKKLNNLQSNNLTIGQTLKVSSTIETPTTPPQDTSYYTVKKGDSLYAIANKYNTSVDELKKINNLSSNALSIGQKLLIPNLPTNDNQPSQNIYTVKKGDSLYSIANSYNTTVDELKAINNLSSNMLSIGQKLIIPEKNNYKTYVVQAGDTIYGISIKFGTTVDKIKSLNNLKSNTLSIGQKLLLS